MMRIILLGNRRISWEVLKLLATPPYRDFFELKTLVTDSDIYENFCKITTKNPPNFISSKDRNLDQIRNSIKNQNIELLLSIQYNWIIPGDILNLVNRNAFNLHNAKLPTYKGYNSISHAILNNDSMYESTIHKMDDAVDSGDIAHIGLTQILPTDTAQSLYLKTINAAVLAVQALLDNFLLSTPIPQKKIPPNSGSFYGRNSLDKIANVTMIKDSELISKIARAVYFPPINYAWTILNDQKFMILPESDAKKIFTNQAVNSPNF